MIAKEGALAIGIGILILLSCSKVLVSDESVTLQSEDEPTEQVDTSQTTEDISPPPPSETEEQLFPQRMRDFRRRRGGGRDMLFGIGRGSGSVPLRASLQLGGYLSDELRYLYGGGEFGWNRSKYSWQTQANYQINWVGREFESSFTKRTNMPTGFSFPTGMPNRPNNPSRTVSETERQATLEMMSSDYQTLSAETRLDYSLNRFFLFGLTSLRMETDSLDRVFVGTGIGKDFFRDVKLDLGVGLTQFFGEDTTQDTRQASTESQGTEVTMLSTLTWRYPISRRMTIDIRGRGYWYVQGKSASAELNVGANLGITDRLMLRPSLIMDYLEAERRGDPFQYQFRASLVYRFRTSPGRSERE